MCVDWCVCEVWKFCWFSVGSGLVLICDMVSDCRIKLRGKWLYMFICNVSRNFVMFVSLFVRKELEGSVGIRG